MRAAQAFRDRLFVHDGRIFRNVARANFSGWRDGLLLAVLLFGVIAILRFCLGTPPWRSAAWSVLGVGVLAGLAAGRLIAARIGFHCFDGVLAVQGLHPASRRRYAMAWHMLGIATLAVMTLIVRPSMLVVSVPAYLAGAGMAQLVAGIALKPRLSGMAGWRWRVRSRLHHPGAGILGAVVLLLSMLPGRGLGPNGLPAVIGGEALIFSLLLTTVDHSVVRVMAIVGHRPGRIIAQHAGALLLFLGLAVPVCVLALGLVVAGVIFFEGLAALLLLALRVLAYCAHNKRFADTLVSIFVGLLAFTAYVMPALLPVVALALLWQLHRRAAAKIWLLP